MKKQLSALQDFVNDERFEGIHDRGLDLSIEFLLRHDGVSEEDVTTLKQAGVIYIGDLINPPNMLMLDDWEPLNRLRLVASSDNRLFAQFC